MTVVAIALLGVLVGVLCFLLWQTRQQASDLRSRYAHIIEPETHLASVNNKLSDAKRALQDFEAENQRRRTKLTEEYEQGLRRHEQLNKEISLLEENLEDLSFGLYKPHFTFQSSEEYKTELGKRRQRERELIKEKRAAQCGVKWTVGDSAKDGQRMTNQYIKLMLRAFNGECDAALTNVTWNNITKMEQRVQKSFEAVNQLGSTMQMYVSQDYLQCKLDELRLTHEYEGKRYQEKEEQRKVRERIRDEEKAQREMDKAREEAEQEEADYEKALAKAREEALAATGAQLEKLSEQIKAMEAKLDEAHQHKERAISRAQLTKSGFVYVISNIGSFGEGMVKIGMTRRMEPMERIDELGDASVPFPFDLHAMLYSDDAPTLEADLHRFLQERRVNLVNSRKEFYAEVALDEVEAFVRERGLSAQFIKIAEAKEYRETLAMRQQRVAVAEPAKVPAQPAPLFSTATASGTSA